MSRQSCWWALPRPSHGVSVNYERCCWCSMSHRYRKTIDLENNWFWLSVQSTCVTDDVLRVMPRKQLHQNNRHAAKASVPRCKLCWFQGMGKKFQRLRMSPACRRLPIDRKNGQTTHVVWGRHQKASWERRYHSHVDRRRSNNGGIHPSHRRLPQEEAQPLGGLPPFRRENPGWWGDFW